VLLATLVLTGVFGALATTLDNASGQEGFSPESEEIAAVGADRRAVRRERERLRACRWSSRTRAATC
jgi:hypothetical protein